MFTLGYSFRPWTDAKSIADGESIRHYVEDTAREYGVDRAHPLPPPGACRPTGRRDDARWTVTAQRTDTGETVTLTCSWLSVCSGYYRYDEGFRPHFEGEERLRRRSSSTRSTGPRTSTTTGKRVVVIGSGATAVTLVPEPGRRRRARDHAAAHAELHHVAARPRPAGPARCASGCRPKVAYPHRPRGRTCCCSTPLFQLSRRRPGDDQGAAAQGGTPEAAAGGLRRRHALHPAVRPVGPAAVPRARRRPVPRAQRRARPTIVTDRIAPVHREGRSSSSPARSCPPTSIVTATGLNLLPMGGMTLTVDGEPVDLAETVSYKGMMLSGVPNFAMVDRLHERLLDAQGRPGQPLRLPAAATTSTRTATSRRRRSRRRRARDAAVPRPRVGLRAAQPRRAAQAGRPHAVAAAPELHPRRAADAARPAGRRGHDLPAAGVRAHLGHTSSTPDRQPAGSGPRNPA